MTNQTISKKHTMKITIEIPEDRQNQIIDGIMQNYPEAGAGMGLQCTNWKYKLCQFEFEDDEEGKTYKLTRVDFKRALALMFTGKWLKGCTPPPIGLDHDGVEDWLCQSDANDADAFVQLAVFGEVIYG